MRELYENGKEGKNPMLGDFSILIADCRDETEQVYADMFDWTTYDSYLIVIQPLQPDKDFKPHRKSIVKVVLRSGERQGVFHESKIRYIQDEASDPDLPDSLLVAFSRILRRIREELILKAQEKNP